MRGTNKKERPLIGLYNVRLVYRMVLFLVVIALYKEENHVFDVVLPGQFLTRFTFLHILWGIWMLDLLMQLIPLKGVIAMGSGKHFAQYYKRARMPYKKEMLTDYIEKSNKGAVRVAIVWSLVTVGIGYLRWKQYIGVRELVLISVFFYVCDLICVVIWCPFQRLFMKNRCCTTCRIFNWDHLMMFVPMLFIPSFYAYSLVVPSILIVVIWEMKVNFYPERFWSVSNDQLKCSNCSDKMCSQKRAAYRRCFGKRANYD